MAYLSDLASTNPLVSTKVGGTSEEGRDIVQLIISSDLNAHKPVHFFDCNIHAREWITGATCIWIIDQVYRHILQVILLKILYRLVLSYLFRLHRLQMDMDPIRKSRHSSTNMIGNLFQLPILMDTHIPGAP